MKERVQLIVQVLICVGFFAALGLGAYLSSRQSASAVEITVEPKITIDPGALTAEAAVIYDPASGRVLFAKNAEEQLPLASLTKLMTATAALSELSPTSTVEISAAAAARKYDLGDFNIRPGQVWKARDLIRYALLASANDAMAAVADTLGTTTFIAKMNATARAMGLAQSYFLDPTGLDLTKGLSGAYGSAHDVAVLTAAFYKQHPGFFESTLLSGKTFHPQGGSFRGRATALPILNIPDLIGAKTGYTDLAGGNITAMFDVGLDHPLVAVVLHSTETGRFADIRTLIDAARAQE